MWQLAALLALIAGMGLAQPARAAETPICFGPGTDHLSSEGYKAVRTLLAEQGGTQARGHIRLFSPSGEANGLGAERLDEVRLEFARNGMAYGRIEAVPHGPVLEHCIVAEVSNHDGPPFFSLWHFPGPYFGRGEVEVTPEWRSRMRFIVADYRLGVTRYCIEGHSDTKPGGRAALALSQARADNVRLELVRQGARWEDIEVRAYGDARLALPTPAGVAEPLNRRVIVDARERCASPR